jgi:2-polyprenyl-3-methyl-5-hydroxy-6-metoxy-1,4-benzoquinol methylase
MLTGRNVIERIVTRAAVPAVKSAAPCWVCGSCETELHKPRSIRRKLVAEDLRVTDSNYGLTLSLRRCRRCGFVFAEGDELNELLQLYASVDDPAYERSRTARATQMTWLLTQLERQQPDKGWLLDVGAATGILVGLAAQRGWHAVGIEPSRSLVAAGRRRGSALLSGSLPHPALRGAKFDAIVLADVLEHVSDPRSFLEHAARLLARGGCLMVVTPDLASIARRLLGRHWWHFRLAHVGYFDQFSLRVLAARVGLDVTAQFRAKWFFQVHYLVERMSRYLPSAFMKRALDGIDGGRFMADRVVPINLFDSWVFILRSARHEY